MRHDAKDQTNPDLPTDRADGSMATPPRAWRIDLGPWKIVALLALVAGTCGAVALLVTAWLVLPYLVVLALILFPTPGASRRPPESAPESVASDSIVGPVDPLRDQTEPGSGGSAASRAAGSDPVDPAPPGTDPTSAEADSTAPVATAAKPKRGRSRSRKAKPPSGPVEVVPATWVEVGPGKFVRVETPATDALVSGPYLPVAPAPAPDLPDVASGGPVPAGGLDQPVLPFLAEIANLYSVLSTPEPEFAAPPIAASDSGDQADRPDPRSGVDSEPPEVPVLVGLPDPSVAGEFVLIASTADGTAPQVVVEQEPFLAPDPSPEPAPPSPASELDVASWSVSPVEFDQMEFGGNVGLVTEVRREVETSDQIPLEALEEAACDPPSPACEGWTMGSFGRDLPTAPGGPSAPVIPTLAGGFRRSEWRSVPRGATRSGRPPTARPIRSRPRSRRGVRRGRQIIRSARPRSPPLDVAEPRNDTGSR